MQEKAGKDKFKCQRPLAKPDQLGEARVGVRDNGETKGKTQAEAEGKDLLSSCHPGLQMLAVNQVSGGSGLSWFLTHRPGV